MRNSYTLFFIAAAFAGAAAAQTQVDLKTQSKAVDFSGATSTTPFTTGATLPATCSVGQMYFLTTAANGQNSYGCTATNTWSPQYAGAQSTTIKSSGTLVGSRTVIDVSAGRGGIISASDTGQEIAVQSSVDTSVVETRADLQGGATLLCNSRSSAAPGVVYTCSMTPTLTAYTAGMLLNWKPDANGAGGAMTLNVDTLGAISIVKADGATQPGSTDIAAGALYQVWYDGTKFRLLAPAGGAVGPAGPAGPTGATGPQGPAGPTGVLAANAEYAASRVMDSTYCPSWQGTFTGSAAMSFTLAAPIAGCSIGIQNNSSQAMTINATTNAVRLNGQNANGTIPACANPANGCKVVVIKANGTTSWDMSAPGQDGATGPQGPAGPQGPSGANFSDYSAGAVSVAANSGSYVSLYSYSAPALGAGACYSISFGAHATGGNPTVEVLVDSTVIATPWTGTGTSNYYSWHLEYCNASGVQNSQRRIYVSPTLYGSSATGMTNLFAPGYGGSDNLVDTTTAVDWSSGHTISVQMNPASGNAQGLFAVIYAH